MSFLLSCVALILLFWPSEPAVLIRQKQPVGLIARATFRDLSLSLDLLASMLDAGASLEAGMLHLGSVVDGSFGRGLLAVASGLRSGSSWQHAWQAWWRRSSNSGKDDPLRQLESSLSFVALSGAPSSLLLRTEARRRRRETQRELQRRAAVLGVKLVLPMGLTALPAFFCIGVVPLVLALFPKTN